MTDVIRQYQPLIYLLKCALNGKKPDADALSGVDFDSLRALSEFHGVSAMAALALISTDDLEYGKEWKEINFRVLRRYMILSQEIDRVCDAFAKAEITFVRLKGCAIWRLYPKAHMREMVDVDLLIDNRMMEQARVVMEALGYKATAINESNHDVFEKPPIFCFEIHEELFTAYHSKYYNYYINCRNKLVGCESGPFEKKFTDDDAYIYQVAHSCKHMHDSGIGLRALTDIYVLLRNKELHRDYIDGELFALGIADEEKILASLAEKLFSYNAGAEMPLLEEEEQRVLIFLLQSGSHGTMEQRIKNFLPQGDNSDGTDFSKSRTRYIKYRLFPPPEYYEKSHPFFYRHKAARPFLVFARLGDSVLHKRGKLKKELSELRRISGKNSVGKKPQAGKK